jgi:hypothetical protein
MLRVIRAGRRVLRAFTTAGHGDLSSAEPASKDRRFPTRPGSSAINDSVSRLDRYLRASIRGRYAGGARL